MFNKTFNKSFYFPLLFQLLLLLILVSQSSCNERQETNIKNMTAIDKNKPKAKNDDPFKKDLRKYMKECGANISSEDDDGEDNDEGEQSAEEVVVPKGQRPKVTDGATNAHWAYEKRRGENGGTYPSHYGKRKRGDRRKQSDEDSEEDEDDYRGSSNRRKSGNRRNHNRKGNKKGRPSNDYDDSRGDNCDDDGGKRGGHGGGGRKRFNSGQWSGMTSGGIGYNRGESNHKNYEYSSGWSSGDPYGQKTEYGVIYASSPELWGSRTGFNTYGGRLMALNRMSALKRAKRQYSEQCISQCVFGYLEMLDDSRVPAETEVIKYFQNKVQNNAERTKIITLARKCFAKLSTAEIAENEDGCEFSKDLAKCLQIDIKGESL